ncbi:MAG: sigma-70 family RNA polymerase sigma factor [Alphaproteobacteria bacterium]|nr:sigma-70 family RNA polymerase sigma factor [Alphaproteobacteria bacterium]
MVQPHHDPTDAELVQRVVHGCSTSLHALYDRHAGLLLALGVRMLRDPARAEDVLHDLFVDLWRDAGAFDPTRGSVRGWLAVRMRSRCLDRYRTRVRRERLLDQHDAPSPSAERDATDVLAGQQVHHAVRSLPDDQRRVVELLYFEGLSSREAADTLGCPVGTVKSRVRLGIAALRRHLAVEETS